MNMPRMLILAVAAIAAGAAALLVRSFLGGGTPAVSARPAPPPIATSDVLVAAFAIQPGEKINASLVRWQRWPTSSVDSSFITHRQTPNIALAVAGTVARAPIVAGEPLSGAKIVHTDSAGFMAATLSPGMRAVSISITTESGAGGFILPNDRVDLIMTVQLPGTPRAFSARIVLSNVRVLAVDQTFKQDRDQKVVLAKSATLELTPAQARVVVRAQAAGPLSLALRPLGDPAVVVASSLTPPSPTTTAPPPAVSDEDGTFGDGINIIRYGVESGVSGKRD